MPSDGRRADRAAEAIREVVAMSLTEGVKDPRITCMITVTAVEVTRDLRHAKVFVSIMGDDATRATTLEGLKSLAAHLRGKLGRALRLRVTPSVDFRLDTSIERAARIDTLLTQLKDGTLDASNASDLD